MRLLQVTVWCLVFTSGRANAGTGVEEALREAEARLAAGDIAAAEASFERLARSEPNHPAPWLGLSRAAAQRGDRFAALEAARAALERAPESAELLAWLGHVLTGVGAQSEAVEALAGARARGRLDQDDVQLEALLLRDMDRRVEARDLLEALRQRQPLGPGPASELALLLLSEDRAGDAEACTSEALTRSPDHPDLLLARGLARARLPDRLEEAVADLSAGLAAGPARVGPAWLELGSVLLQLGRPEEAVVALERAAEAAPEAPEPVYRLASALRTVGRTEESVAALERFQGLSRRADTGDWGQKHVRAALNEAEGLARADRLFEALERIDALLARSPADARVHGLRSQVLASLSRDSEALESARRAVELAPGAKEYRFLHGMLLVRLGEPAEGELALRRALALDPELAAAHELLGIVAANADRHAEAVEWLERALALGRDTPDLHLTLARSLGALGRIEDRDRQLEAARRPPP